jgi:hypothetical protein
MGWMVACACDGVRFAGNSIVSAKSGPGLN